MPLLLEWMPAKEQSISRVIAGPGHLTGWRRVAELEGARRPEAEWQGSSRQGSGAGGSTTCQRRMAGLIQAGQWSWREDSMPTQNGRAHPGRAMELEGGQHADAEWQGSSRQGNGAGGRTACRRRMAGLIQAGQWSWREDSMPTQNGRAHPGRAMELEGGQHADAEWQGSSRQGNGAGGRTACRRRMAGLIQAGQWSWREDSMPTQNGRAHPGRAMELEGGQHADAEWQGSSRQGNGAGGRTACRRRMAGLIQAGQWSWREDSMPTQNGRAHPGRAMELEGGQHADAEWQGSSRQGSGAGGSTACQRRMAGLIQAGQWSRREGGTPRQNVRACPGRAAEQEGAQHANAEWQGPSSQRETAEMHGTYHPDRQSHPGRACQHSWEDETKAPPEVVDCAHNFQGPATVCRCLAPEELTRLTQPCVKNGSSWTYGTLTCKVIAFLGVLSCFHTAFMLFCISVTRYLAIAHHRFYTKRLTFWTCLAVICMVWTLSVAMAFPPVLDVGTFSFIREEDQCTFQHRSFRANDSLGFMLLLALILLATQLVYLKLIFFVHDRRKMKPVQFVPAISQNWTFHGPGASGQAAANWLAGFGRGPTPPTLLGIRQNTNTTGRRRLLILDEFKTEKRISRMFYIMTFFFLTLWGPYLVACYWRVFARGPVVPGGYLTAAVWMSFAQAGVNPFICIFSNRELRRCFSTTLLYCRKSRLPREPYCVI
ncbi:UNVERIFIED_CONTAM: hypothetical protein FKN15_063498 [Acipenser sinensis]